MPLLLGEELLNCTYYTHPYYDLSRLHSTSTDCHSRDHPDKDECLDRGFYKCSFSCIRTDLENVLEISTFRSSAMPCSLCDLSPIYQPNLTHLILNRNGFRRGLGPHTRHFWCSSFLDLNTTQTHSPLLPTLFRCICPLQFRLLSISGHATYLYRIYHRSFHPHSNQSRL